MELWLREEPRTLVLKDGGGRLSLIFSRTSRGKEDDAVELDLLSDDSSLHLDLEGCRLLTRQPCHGLLGLITLQGDIFLVLVTACTRIGAPVPRSSVYRIQEVDFFSLTSALYDDFYPVQPSGTTRLPDSLEPAHDFEPDAVIGRDSSAVGGIGNRSAEHPCAGLRKLLNAGHFYFSPDFDLSTRLQAGYRTKGVNFTLEDTRFLWNTYMIEGCLNYRAQLPQDDRAKVDQAGFFLLVIQGFVGCRTVKVGNFEGQLSLISRLSWKRAGTRYITRGIDDDGNVANYVESETILSLSHLLSSFVQIRGSIPIFWEQQGLQAFQHRIQITRSADAAQPAFERHFVDLTDRYGTIHCINLLGQGKTESSLSDAYASHLITSKNADGKATFIDFDFHAMVRRAGYEAVNEIKEVLRDKLETANSFLMDPASKSPITNQGAVFRTNCLDCLDRTNYVQGLISRAALELTLIKVDPLSSSVANEQLWSIHQNMWADNGDALSRIYAGTGAINSSATRSGTGKKTLGGLLSDVSKSVARTYINNFSDKDKQVQIDTLLGLSVASRPVIIHDPIRDEIASRLKDRIQDFSRGQRIKLTVATYNVNGKPPGEDLSSWLHSGDGSDVMAIGFQEIVELNAQSIVNADPVKLKVWEEAILSAVNKREKTAKEPFILLRNVQLVGTALMILIRSSLANSVRAVEGAVKKTGLKGMSGNKGAVAIRLEIHDTSFCFVTSHLAAGHSNVDERNRDYWTIMDDLAFQKGRKMDMHDNVVWFGDLNYRIAMLNEEARDLIQKRKIPTLLENDQLCLAMKSQSVFVGFEEARIGFLPTYKYDNGTDIYDSSEKQRIPSWTDRVLKRGQNLAITQYGRGELRASDHRPVYATLETTVRIVDVEKKKEIQRQIASEVDTKMRRISRSGLAAVTSPQPKSVSTIKSKGNGARVAEKDLIDLGEPNSQIKPVSWHPSRLDLASMQPQLATLRSARINANAKTPFDPDFLLTK